MNAGEWVALIVQAFAVGAALQVFALLARSGQK